MDTRPTETPSSDGGKGQTSPQPQSDLLTDERHARRDLNLVRRAVRERWRVPPAMQQLALERIGTVLGKETVTVISKDGPTHVEGAADANALKAIALLVEMEKQNQTDDHLTDRNARLDDGLATDRLAFEPVVLYPTPPPPKPPQRTTGA